MFFLYWYCMVNIAHAWSLIEHVIRLEHPLQGKALESWAGHCTTRSVTWHGKDSIKSIYLKAEEIVTNKMYYKSFSPLLRALFCCLLWHVSQSRSLPFQFWSEQIEAGLCRKFQVDCFFWFWILFILFQLELETAALGQVKCINWTVAMMRRCRNRNNRPNESGA